MLDNTNQTSSSFISRLSIHQIVDLEKKYFVIYDSSLDQEELEDLFFERYVEKGIAVQDEYHLLLSNEWKIERVEEVEKGNKFNPNYKLVISYKNIWKLKTDIHTLAKTINHFPNKFSKKFNSIPPTFDQFRIN